MSKSVGTNDFEREVINSEQLVLVDFWAQWCGPCRMLTPIIDEVAEEKKDKCKVLKLNVDDAPEIAAKYEIMNIPTILFFKEGKIVDKNIGALSKQDIVSKIEQFA